MTTRPYQQCTRCVMDTSDPEILFDKNGYCNHCTWYYDTISPVTEEFHANTILHKVAARIKKAGRGKKYDCVLGISGGEDSCYTAWLLKELGLRVLAVHMDNGWDSDAAVRNINSIVDHLKLDYQSVVLDWEEFKDLQLAFLKASVPEIETPTDMAILGALHKVAASFGIKFIISGGNVQTEGILPRIWHYDAKDMVYLKAIHERYGSGRLRNFPAFGYLQHLYYKYYHGIRMIYLLNYTCFRKKETIAALKKEMSWRDLGGKHYESLYTRFVQSYILPQKFNIDYRRATLSTQICSGEVSRDYALNKLQEPAFDPAVACEQKQYVAKKLGISLPVLEEILDQPPKNFKDYPNDQRKLEFIYRVYRRYNKL